MPRGERFGQGIGRTGRDRHRRNEAGLHDAQGEERGAGGADIGSERGREVGAAREARHVDMMREQRSGGDHRRDGGDGGDERAHGGVDPALRKVGAREAFIDDGALLEEDHPGCHGGADIGEDERDECGVEAARQWAPVGDGVREGMAVGMGHEGRGDEEQVEGGKAHQQPFPGRIVAEQQRADDHADPDQHRQPGRHAEIEAAGLDGDEFGDERQDIAEDEVAHGEIAPEGAETLEDKLGVAPSGRNTEAHGHFLDEIGHDEGCQDERHEEPDAVGGAGGGVGHHARPVILAEHDKHAGSGEQP